MRLVPVAALACAAIFLASITSAQGLGAVAEREKEKRRSAPAKPAKVYTDNDVNAAPVPSAPDSSPSATTAGGDGEKKAGEKGEDKAEKEKADAEAAEQRAAAEKDWRKRMETAQKIVAAYQDVINKVQEDLSNLASADFGPNRASKISFLEESQQKLKEAQDQLAKIEGEGRQNGYR